MSKTATEVMQDLLSAAVTDAIGALKAASGGMPNALARDLAAIHLNTAHADLPQAVRDSIAASVRAAFQRLLKEGYTVAPNSGPPPRPRPAPTIVPRGQFKPPAGRPQRPGPGGGPGGPRKSPRPPAKPR